MFSYFIVVYCFVVVMSPLPHTVVAVAIPLSCRPHPSSSLLSVVVVVLVVVAIYHTPSL